VGVEPWELQGRWLPSSSVDQYAATLLRWWGMNESQLDTALPNLANFGSARNLGFMRAWLAGQACRQCSLASTKPARMAKRTKAATSPTPTLAIRRLR
jgi:hypothetical protein